jgi:hypothetical protein
MTLELILGVFPEEKYVEIAERIILGRYPEGPKSLLLDLPPWEDFNSDYVPFYGKIAKLFQLKGTRIVNGDLYSKPTPQEIIDIEDKKNLTLLDCVNSLNHYIPLAIGNLIDFNFRHKKSKGIIEVIKKEDPRVVVVHRVQADFIKKQFPNVPYIAFSYKSLIEGLISKAIFPFSPCNPDEIVKVGK